MRSLPSIITTLAVGVAFAPAGFAAELADPSSIDRFLATEIAARGLPGVVALVTDSDGDLYLSAFGQRDVAGSLPMTGDTIFRIASMTKPVAATAIMMLVEEGKLSLDDEIGEHVAEYAEMQVLVRIDADGSYSTRPAAGPMTIRQLLSHSSGLAYAFASDEVTSLNARGINGPDTPLLYDPGTGWSYAHGISIVGGVLEAIEGVGLDEFLARRLFEPLDMHDTFYAVPEDKIDRVTTTHRRNADATLAETANPDAVSSAVSGDGGLNSTAADYARFIRLILNDGVAPDGTRLLSSASIAELGRNQLAGYSVSLQDEPTPALSRAFPLGAGRDGFGLGFQVTGAHDDPNLRAPGSMSWAGIFNTEFWIDPENGIGAILLLQYLPFYDADAIDLLQGFEQRVYQQLR